MANQDLQTLLVRMSADLRSYERNMARMNGTTNRATRRAERRFDQMNRNMARSADRAGRVIRRAVAGLVGAYAIREAVQLADAWTEAGNQLRSVAASIDRPVASLEDLVSVAIRSRGALESTVTLYARLERSLASLGATQEQALRITELVNMAFVAGGASASEQRSAILQLSQALASGALQGEELRAIRENAPLVAQAIADAMGVGIGQLRDLGAQGRLTADVVANAIIGAGADIEAQFQSTELTVAQAFQNLRTAAVEAVGGASQASGATASFAGAIDDLAETIRNNREGLQEFAALLAQIAGAAVEAVAALGRMLNTTQAERIERMANLSAELRQSASPLARTTSRTRALRRPEVLRDELRLTLNGEDLERALAELRRIEEDMSTTVQSGVNFLGMPINQTFISRQGIQQLAEFIDGVREAYSATEEVAVSVGNAQTSVRGLSSSVSGAGDNASDAASFFADLRHSIELAADAMRDAKENAARLAERQLQAELDIAEARGDSRLVRSLERELSIRQAIAELQELGLTADKARAIAVSETDALQLAQRQGEFREVFRQSFSEGVLAALQGDQESFERWIRDGATRGLERALNNIADMLFNLFSQAMGNAGKQRGGGFLSAIGSVVAGVFGGGAGKVGSLVSAGASAGGSGAVTGAISAVASAPQFAIPQMSAGQTIVKQEFHLHAEGAVMTQDLLDQMDAKATAAGAQALSASRGDLAKLQKRNARRLG